MIGTLAFLFGVLAVRNTYYSDGKVVAEGKLATLSKQQSGNDLLREEPLGIIANLKTETANSPTPSEDEAPPPFNIPRYVWIYVEQSESETFLTKRYLENIRHFAGKNNFTVTLVNQKNF